ncbi:hypothetical protein [Oricola cellulosilytica]|uniref:Uncharacterized protein n=1 Tax=Oricola cellulosilytica TaxID=1429082 RepID=A0A4R0PIH4_9HYPH|nr:hypothetical protein [Oricola cellulosilytica]TCD15314.1 hypothetical protein E0D97_07200 [Oricola cellulosilytica]
MSFWQKNAKTAPFQRLMPKAAKKLSTFLRALCGQLPAPGHHHRDGDRKRGGERVAGALDEGIGADESGGGGGVGDNKKINARNMPKLHS